MKIRPPGIENERRAPAEAIRTGRAADGGDVAAHRPAHADPNQQTSGPTENPTGAAGTGDRPVRSRPVGPDGGSSELLTSAVSAAARGWHVFPLRPGDKRPAVRDWEARATTDAERIRRCWTAGPFNVGVACGPSGLVVIDLDTAKPDRPLPDGWPGCADGEDVLAALSDRHGQPYPVSTYAVRTGSGGLHLYFAAPAGLQLRNSAGRLGPLIDTRAGGGYVVAAGSRVTGRSYTALDDTAAAAELPGWLARLLAEPAPSPVGTPAAIADRPGYAGAALRGEVQRVLDAVPGQRNDTLFRATSALGELVAGGLLPESLVDDALTAAGLAIGLGGRECAATIRSGLGRGARSPRRGTA
jgi:hypothetical protein